IGGRSKLVKKANTLIWNGPLGHFEQPPYNHGTISMARLIAARSKCRAFGVVGGGETIAALRQSKMAEYIDHISTGGGAMLEFLAGKKLPGIEALR
ncbi:MAG: phosphoglycerate kinase, partial [Patescibacteria group bacterium]